MRFRHVLGLCALFTVLPSCTTTPEEPDAAADGAIADSGRDAGTPPGDAGPDEDARVAPDAGEDAAVELDGGDVDAWVPECTVDGDCDDGDACTADTCASGVCDSAAIDPDDGDVCTDDACDPTTGVSHTAVSVDDGDVCTADACDATAGVSHTPIADCCETTADCATGVCSGNVCQPASCLDGVQNGAETDVDCGGSECAACALADTCAVDGDCASNACVGGTCVECASAATCPGADTDCRIRTCFANVCGVSFTAAGTATSAQSAGDCRESQCDGAGNVVAAVLDTDLPVDGNGCTVDVCTAGDPSNPPAPAETPCTGGGGAVCDGVGTCVGCVTTSDCPGSDTECATRTCTAGVCGVAYTTAGTPVASQTAGDCQENQCNGAGSIVSAASDGDVPADDGSQCTDDVCVLGTPAHPPLAAGSTCAQDGGTHCDGAGACVECVTASDCGSSTECATRTCTAGVCGVSYTASGTPVASQVAGDCQENQCDGAGVIVSVPSDSDLPGDDTNQCTTAECVSGVPGQANASAGTPCSQGGGTQCDGAGSCVECVTASDCPGTDTACATRTCTAGTCGMSYAPAGTPTATQTAGDCSEDQCDGAGAIVSVPSDSDLPADDGNQCTTAVCMSGVPGHVNAAGGTPCSQSGGVECDGAGSCVQCIAASECPGSDTECQVRTCTAGTCGVAYTAAGTPVSTQTAGNCLQSQCDGLGGVASVADDGDLPVDANECTDDVCTSGVPSNPARAAGTPCTQGGGTACDGAGMCVSPPAVASTSPADGSSVIASTTIAVTFTTAMSPASLTAQTTAGACTGSIQVSLDDFATCVAFASASATMSAGDTIATLTPAPGLLVNRIYGIRVTTAATNAAGLALPTQFTQTMGFATGSPTSSNGVVIAQVYGGGGSSGALYGDYVVLHNRSGSPVTVDGWSIQYASAGGSSWSPRALTGAIQPGAYYLVHLGSGGVVPTPDVTVTTLSISATAGKIALVSTTTALTGTCPTDSSIVDLVGYGTGVSCYDGSGAAPAPSATTEIARTSCGDAGDNSLDFATRPPAPRNSASPITTCPPAVLNESGVALEADYCAVQFPLSLTVATGATTDVVYGRIYEAGVTDPAGPDAAVIAQLGYGPASANPEYEGGWIWVGATYNLQDGNNDEYQASFTAPAAGEYRYAYRFSLDNGVSWTLCDANSGDFGAGSNGGLTFDLTSLPVLTVTP